MNAERYGIDPGAENAPLMVEIASYLEERGVPLSEIHALGTLERLNDRVQRHLFGLSGEWISLADAAKEAGLDEERARRMLRTLGFPDPAPDFLMTRDDLDVLRLLGDFSNLIGEDQVMHLTRVIGSALGRMAEATADLVRVNIEGPQMHTVSRSEYLKLTEVLTHEGLPRLAHAMDRILRYHILRVSAQDWDIDTGAKATTTTGTIGFADMVGFTAHSGLLSTNELADVIDAFEGRVSETITSLGGRVIKFIGDEVLFLFADPSIACRCSLDLLRLAADESIPDVRVGLAFGEVITRYGDCYGPVVNRAARLVDVAPARTILVTPEVAERARAFSFEERDPLAVKGIDEPLDHLSLLGG
jgi:adenylate cyclase